MPRPLLGVPMSLAEAWETERGRVGQKGMVQGPFETIWLDLEGIMLSDICQTEKDKYRMISLTCGI